MKPCAGGGPSDITGSSGYSRPGHGPKRKCSRKASMSASKRICKRPVKEDNMDTVRQELINACFALARALTMKDVMVRVCAWCNKAMGLQFGRTAQPTGGICKDCMEDHFKEADHERRDPHFRSGLAGVAPIASPKNFAEGAARAAVPFPQCGGKRAFGSGAQERTGL